MRLKVLVCVFVAICMFGCQAFLRRSATIDLKLGYSLTYTVVWGMGMDQRLTLGRANKRWAAVSSDWIEIWKKPYNSGAVVYATEDGDRYYIGTSYNMLVVTLAEGKVHTSCDRELIPARTALADKLLIQRTDRYEQIDPGGERFLTYIRQDALSGPVPVSPPQSKYYLGVRYLGRFGIVRPERKPGHGLGRGDEVRFVPASSSAEPRLGLEFHCG